VVALPGANAATPAPGHPATIAVGTSSLGPIVVDDSGHTLYRYDKDTPGSGMSACNGACATAWPPAIVTGQPSAGAGVAGTIGTITRADGSQQVTLDGHPLYRFAGDQSTGDTTGDGFGGIWHVVHANASAASSGSAPAAPGRA
jgi:predicted lipoprotein with Yx(FWY)xxD motif